ncbi:MAG: type II toxin-antitoxin system HipA family toxin [Janthinobacterium lividum]
MTPEDAPRRGRPGNRFKRLSVYLYDCRIGTVSQDSHGRLTTTYDTEGEWREAAGFPPLSLSMPLLLPEHGDKTTSAFLWGLLPENPSVLAALAREYKVAAGNPLALLSIVGEDCAGAVQFLVDDAVLTPDGVEWLDEQEIGRRLAELRTQESSTGRRVGERGQFSLGGAQSKTALLLNPDGDQFGVPSGKIPTTHILKPPMPGLDGQVENEHFCLSLANAAGLNSANSTVRHFASETCIVVTRYDRRRRPDSDIGWMRVHQEDCCQALSIRPALKYQKDGGPSARKVMDLLRTHSSEPDADRERFARALALNFALLGTDAHAKNFSIMLAPGDEAPQVRLAPLYDMNSYLPYVTERPGDIRMAMSIGSYYENGRIMPRHWQEEARSWSMDAGQVMDYVRNTFRSLPDLAQTVARQCHEDGLNHPIIDKLVVLLAARCRTFGQLYL